MISFQVHFCTPRHSQPEIPTTAFRKQQPVAQRSVQPLEEGEGGEKRCAVQGSGERDRP